MDIQGTLNSWSSSMYSAGSSAGASLKGLADTAVQKGKLGYNTTVSMVKDNPRAAVVTGLALAAVAAAVVYSSMGDSNGAAGG
ncbi:MAG: hypothetical protein S4CHLAM6_02170 [Chlamydiae bacterium]|nr:hypothetical protein [Chlamydiota bacterium]